MTCESSSVPTVIRKRADFLAANRGIRVARPGFVLLVRPNGGQGMRYGITVTKKIGNAVTRNRAKRRLRELAREFLPELGQDGYDYVLIARDRTPVREWSKLREDVRRALQSLPDQGQRRD